MIALYAPVKTSSLYLHIVWLVAHGHWLASHVAYVAGLWRLGDSWEALWGLRSHILWKEGGEVREQMNRQGLGVDSRGRLCPHTWYPGVGVGW